VADMLAIMIERAKNDGHIEGVIPYLVDGGLSILQYADDTIFLLNMILRKHRIETYTFNLRAIIGSKDKLP
jgi:hypothetical protein